MRFLEAPETAASVTIVGVKHNCRFAVSKSSAYTGLQAASKQSCTAPLPVLHQLAIRLLSAQARSTTSPATRCSVSKMQMRSALCLFMGLAALTTFVVANPPHGGYHHHDPCASSGHDGFTWAASEGQELDHVAMQAMPTPFVQYGWRVYTNKVCSYKGLEAECPTLQHYNDHPSFNEFFWDTLFPGRKPDGSFCTSASGCCSKNCADGKCCVFGKAALKADCTATGAAGCCSGNCQNNRCCLALNQACGTDNAKCCSTKCTGGVCVA